MPSDIYNERVEAIRKFGGFWGYFRSNRSRMNCYHVAKGDYPIGSCELEAANKVLLTHRVKRSGQRWGRDGGQGVPAYRALLKSDHFDRAWRIVAPKNGAIKKTTEPSQNGSK